MFCCLFLDNRHRILAFEQMFRGTLNGTAVYPREIVKRALALIAAAVILVHNHPSGVAEPSRADQALTDRLREALALVDVRVLDHIVIGDGETVSFSERGMLALRPFRSQHKISNWRTLRAGNPESDGHQKEGHTYLQDVAAISETSPPLGFARFATKSVTAPLTKEKKRGV